MDSWKRIHAQVSSQTSWYLTKATVPILLSSYLNAAGASDPESAAGIAGAAILQKYITDTRTMISDMKLPKTIQVGTSDAGSYFNKEVLSSVDYGMANVHPWFANTTIDAAAGWTYEFFQNTNVALAQSLTNKVRIEQD